jgi:hypothetical protein
MWNDEEPPTFVGAHQPGDIVRDCIILRPIGRGGMGEVYRALQRSLRRLVAVKVVTGGTSGASTLALEAINTARLLHPNVVAIHDADTTSERPSIVMELVDGINLRTWITRHWRSGQPPPAPHAVRAVVRQIALALAHAHASNIVHLDIKPENVLVNRRQDEEVIKVVDFGIARQLETPHGTAMGTPGYMAPEQVNAAMPDARADLFALGVVTYELITGRHPFSGSSLAETYYNTLTLEPAFPDDPSWAPLVEVTRRALRKAPEQRYQTADALLADLDMPMEAREPERHNPLLSEFPAVVQAWWYHRSSGALAALVSCIWGALTLVFSAALGTACVRVLWTPAAAASGYEMIFGYAVEPNAGLWYLVGTPVCLLAGFGLVEAAYRGLQRTDTLTGTEAGGLGALARVAATNRAVFRVLTPLIIVTALGFVAVPELVRRHDHAFGWVQTDLAGDSRGQTYAELRRSGRIGELQPVAALCDGCRITVSAVSNQREGFVPPARWWFQAFLLLALSHQMLLASVVMWICAKVVFFFWLLSTALLGGGRHGLRLSPDFQDTHDYRFGLGRLDNVYYAILWLVVIGSIALSLQAIANVTKGTYFLAGDPTPALFGQAVLLLGTVLLLLIVLLTPAGVFLFLNIKAVDQEVARLAVRRRRLETQLQAAPPGDERERLRAELRDLAERRAIVARQSLLPVRRPSFLVLCGASVLLLLLVPLSVRWFGSSSHNSGGAITGAVCTLSGNPQPLR